MKGKLAAVTSPRPGDVANSVAYGQPPDRRSTTQDGSERALNSADPGIGRH